MAGDTPGATTASAGLAPTTTPEAGGLPDCDGAASSTSASPMSPTPPAHGSLARAGFWTLAVGSIGVVFGDIGTSPLYAFSEAMRQANERAVLTSDAILGVVSLALWALILIVTVKYVL